ncbi:MAG: hypothetical protein IJP00_01025 [Firmicutes bacterium]|nr:hypothetical protein [Bacillota bacterium]
MKKTVSEQLYEEFLDNYKLKRGLYNHALELSKPNFVEVDKLQKLVFQKIEIPATMATKNGTIFNTKLNLAKLEAEKAVKDIVRRHRTFRMDGDDVERLCDFMEQEVLNKLLWPFHLLTVEAELEREQFFPIAHEMEKIVQQVFEIIDNFYNAFFQSEQNIQQRAKANMERMDRQTDAWAANAPVRVRGNIRELGGHLHIYANVESTVTPGMITADYQVNELVANQDAKRESIENQKSLLDYLERSLLEVVDGYISCWYDCLENKLNKVVGKCVFGPSVYLQIANVRPHIKENAKKLFTRFSNDDDFAHIEYFLRFYGYDMDDLFGQKVAMDMYNGYVRNKEIDELDFYNNFYCYFYGVEHAIEYEPLFKRFKELLKDQTRKMCEKRYEKDKESYTDVYCDRILAPTYRLLDAIPGLDNKHRRYLSNACHYIFYDVMGDTNFRDIYDEKNDDFFFDWSPEE